MRMAEFAHLQRLERRLLRSEPGQPPDSAGHDDINMLNDMFTAGVVSIFGDIFMSRIARIVLFVMDWRLALVALAVIPLIAMVTQWFRRNARDWSRRADASSPASTPFSEHPPGYRRCSLPPRKAALVRPLT